jgi:hypothetical protein
MNGGLLVLPPVLEIYVVWHPGDVAGREICNELLEHFHGSAFSGLIGGAIEVYARREADGGMPRPIPFTPGSLAEKIRAAQFVPVVPVLGNEFAAAVGCDGSAWRSYATQIMHVRDAEPTRIGVFPVLLDKGAVSATELGGIFGRVQRIAAGAPSEGESKKSLRCRDLAQGIAQLLSAQPSSRITVFISHTKLHSPGEPENVEALLGAVREAIGCTRLADFFDASDLQVGADWGRELRC